MSTARRWTRLIGSLTLLLTTALAPASARQRISVELETSQLSVVNGVAEATFKIIVKNEEAEALAGAWLVFDDGFEVAVGDVAAEASVASESTTRTFDVSEQESRHMPLNAKLKYAVNGNPVEQDVHLSLRLAEQR